MDTDDAQKIIKKIAMENSVVGLLWKAAAIAAISPHMPFSTYCAIQSNFTLVGQEVNDLKRLLVGLFQWLFGNGFVRKNSYPQLAFSFHVAIDRHTACFNLCILDPAAAQRLQAILPKGQVRSAGGMPLAAAALHFTVLYPFRH